LLFAWRASAAPSTPAAEPLGLQAEAQCEVATGPGKVQCVVRIRPVGGGLQWGDVIVVKAPPFAPPLRTRLAAGDASKVDGEGADFALALAATRDGRGELGVVARAVVCGAAGCRPVTAEASAKVSVGAPADGGPSR
jgi:hypothetical protein